MKAQNENNKLKFHKKSICQLDQSQMTDIKGGGDHYGGTGLACYLAHKILELTGYEQC